MRVSAGFILIDDNTMQLLACEPYGKKNVFDLPKGGIEDGENPLEAAKRELKEETGIVLPEDTTIIDCGEREYLAGDKALHLFIAHYPISLEELHCDSTFEFYGRTVPEHKGFKLVDTLDYFYANLRKLVNDILIEYGLDGDIKVT